MQAARRQVKERFQIVSGKNRFSVIHAIHPAIFQAEHSIRTSAHQLQFVKTDHHCQIFLPGQ